LTIRVSVQTVGNVLQRYRLPPAPKRKRTTTWPVFIRTHLALVAGTEFFTAEVVTLRGLVISSSPILPNLSFRHTQPYRDHLELKFKASAALIMIEDYANFDVPRAADLVTDGSNQRESQEVPMCDYSLMHVRSRAAIVGDRLQTKNFGTGTRGFASPQDLMTAVCVLPGTELAFDAPIAVSGAAEAVPHKTAIFRQINREQPHMHHDALEFPDGRSVLLTLLADGQNATVLQLPADPKTVSEARALERVAVVG